jgi:hypothetical protein
MTVSFSVDHRPIEGGSDFTTELRLERKVNPFTYFCELFYEH